MQQSYTKNYIKIYFWQILSIVLNLLSLVIVIPRLSSHPDIYGIYSICVSSVIFLSYADLGFLNAGFKYASEYYAKGDLKQEVKIIGFVALILLIFVLLFSAVIFTLSLHPEWLIKNLSDLENVRTAKQLLLILALFAPNVIFQRALGIVFGVRLKDYIYQGVMIFVNLCKIGAVFIFFRGEHYEIVNYFLFCQAITTLGLLMGFVISGKQYGFTLLKFCKALRFSGELYNETKSLALSTFFVTISWILYYEMDIYAIARLSGTRAVAYYSIGLTCLSFFRSIFGALFNPFTARFNHFIALNEEQGLKNLYKTVICVMLPVVVFPILSLACLSTPFVFAWVGKEFSESIPVVRLLVLSNIVAFIIYPSSILLIARKEIKALYYLAIVQPLFFWVGIAIFYSHIGYLAFAYFKLAAFIISGMVYLWLSLKFLNLSLFSFFNIVIKPAILPVILMIACFSVLSSYLPQEKGKLNLILVVAEGAGVSALAIGLYYFTSSVFRDYIKNIYTKLNINSLRHGKK